MSTETVSIGCKLPNGYVLEVDYKVTERVGNGSVTMLSRGEKYQRIQLGGTHEHTAAARRQGIQLPSILNPQPYVTKVPKDFWEAWVKAHPRAWVLRSGNIFVMPTGDEASAKAALMDANARPSILQPMDPSKPMKVGQDNTVTKLARDD